MIKNVYFDSKEFKHGISLWINIEHEGIKIRKLLGSTFKDKADANLYILNMATQFIK